VSDTQGNAPALPGTENRSGLRVSGRARALEKAPGRRGAVVSHESWKKPGGQKRLGRAVGSTEPLPAQTSWWEEV